MPFSDLVRGAGLRGSPELLGPGPSLRLGRAIGTMFRRRQPASQTVVLGRSAGAAEAVVSDGVAAGLVASGFVVADLGVVESDDFTAALRRGPNHALARWPVVGGVIISAAGDSVGVMLFAGHKPLFGEHLSAVAAIADAGAFANVDGGAVVALDRRTLPTFAGVDDAEATDDDGDSDNDDEVAA